MVRKTNQQVSEDSESSERGSMTVETAKEMMNMVSQGFKAYLCRTPILGLGDIAQVRLLGIYHPDISRCLRKFPMVFITDENRKRLGDEITEGLVFALSKKANELVEAKRCDFNFADSEVFNYLGEE